MSEQANPGDWVDAGPMEKLRERGVVVVHAGGRPVAVFHHEGKVRAIDNRCPHMGFPLHKGTVRDGLVTCHWHQARFDLCSGCTFDLWADDTPAFDVKVHDDQVMVRDRPRHLPDKGHHLSRLRHGLEHNIGLIQAKSIVGLLSGGASVESVVAEVARFGAERRSDWSPGMTMLALVLRLSEHLSKQTLYHALCRAARQVAGDCAGRPPRTAGQPLDATHEPARLGDWMNQWVRVRHATGAERVVLSAIAQGGDAAQLIELLIGAQAQRVFASTGHPADFANTAVGLAERLGWPEFAKALLPLVVPGIANARGGEEQAHWRTPIELIEPLDALSKKMPTLLETPPRPGVEPSPELGEALAGEDPLAILAAIEGALGEGVAAPKLAQRIAHAAGLRLARFATSNDITDWFGPQHTFIYCNAICEALDRAVTPPLVMAMAHGALAVYHDRFLNIPAAKLPGERGDLTTLPADGHALTRGILETLDQRANIEQAAAMAARYLRLGHEPAGLVDCLVWAQVREDLDFHTLQVIDAAAAQAARWGWDAPEAEQVIVGALRQLAAQCPTRRAGLQASTIAQRLHRGDRMYEEE